MNRHEFHDAVLLYCVVVGASQTSGFRTGEHNRVVGGVVFSPHQVDLGRDVVYEIVPPEHYRREWAERLGLRLIVSPSYDHLQPLDWKAG